MPSSLASRVVAPEPRCFTADSGAQIVVVPTRESASDRATGPSRSAGTVAVQLWILGGTAAERDDEHGCAHLMEHMLFKPSAQGLDLATEIERLGGDINAFTSHDETVVHATVPVGGQRQALDVLLSQVLQPQVDPAALAVESGVVLEEIHQYRDDPGAQAMQALYAALFGRHPYARPVLGTAAEVRGHDAARLRRFHRRIYAGRRVKLVVVGPVDVRAVVRRARRWLDALPRGRAVDEGSPVLEPVPRARVRVGTADVRDAQVQLAWRAPAVPSTVACVLEVASIVLGYGDASRLTRHVRRNQRLVSDVMASFYPARGGSSMVVAAHAKPSQVDQAVAAMLAETEALGRVPLPADDLDRARTVLRSDLVYRRETAQGHAHALGYNLSLGGSLELDSRYHQLLDGLDATEIRKVCAQWLRPQHAALSVVMPRGRRASTVAMRKRLAVALRPGGGSGSAISLRRDRQGVLSATLPGGLRLLVDPDRRVPMAAGWLLWPGGLRREDARRQGATSVMATLLTRGCAAIDGDALAREIEGDAAALDGFSSRNSAGLHFECMAASVSGVLRRAVQCAQAPLFATDELDEERRVAQREFLAEQDDPAKVAFRLALSTLYRGHPFRWRRRGTPASLARLTSASLRRTWAQWYPLGRAVLAVRGDVDVDGVVGLLEELLADATDPGDAPPWSGGSPRYPRRPQQLLEHREREQAHLVMAMPGPALTDRRIPALDVLLAVLGGQAGRLFLALREAEGLVYHVSATSTEGTDAGDVVFHAAASPGRMPRARRVLEDELARICDERVGADELERAKALLVGQHAMGMERHSRVASQLAFNEAFGLGRHHHLRYRGRVQRVKAAAVRTLARQLLDPQRRVVAVVGPG